MRQSVALTSIGDLNAKKSQTEASREFRDCLPRFNRPTREKSFVRKRKQQSLSFKFEEHTFPYSFACKCNIVCQFIVKSSLQVYHTKRLPDLSPSPTLTKLCLK